MEIFGGEKRGRVNDLFFATGLVLFLFFGAVYLLSETSQAANPPATITYQGKLLINNLSATTTQSIKLVLYDAASAGTVLYTVGGTTGVPTAISVTPSSGIFSVDLGGTGTNSLNPEIFKNNQNVYLEVTVGSETLTPRKQITAAPYAFNSKYLDGAGTNTVSTTTYIPLSASDGSFTFNTTTIATSTLTSSTITTANITNLNLLGTVSGLASTNLSDTADLVRLTANQTFTGLNIFSATTTFATSTFTSSTINNANITNLSVISGLSLPNNIITDAMVADTITASNYLPLAGGTMAGAIAMGGYGITGLGNLLPNTDNLYDIGASSTQWRYGNFQGGILIADGSATSTILNNNLIMGEAAGYNRGVFSVDSSGNTSASGTWQAYGNTTLGDASGDSVTVNGRIASHLIPSAGGNTYDLGAYGNTWKDVYASGTLYLGSDSFSDNGFVLTNRDMSGYTVPYFTPTTNNRSVAFDLFPKGSPTDNANGTAWMDICSSDIAADGTNYECLTLGKKTVSASNGVALVGASAGGTGTVRDLTLQQSGGKVGIGTTSPGKALDIVSRFAGDGIRLQATTTVSYSPGVVFTYNGTDTGWLGGAFGAGHWAAGTVLNDVILASVSGKIILATNGASPTARLTIANGGNIGIGTASPGEKLVVSGGIFAVTDGTTSSTLGSNFFSVATSTSNRSGLFYVDSSGNTSASGTWQAYGNTTLQGSLSATANTSSLRSVKLSSLTSAPDNTAGNIYFNSTDGKFYGYTANGNAVDLSVIPINDWGRFSSTYGALALMTSSTYPVWFDGAVYASSTLIASGNVTFGDTVADTLTFNGVLGTINISDNVNSTTTLSRNSLALGQILGTYNSGIFSVDSSGNTSASGTLQVFGSAVTFGTGSNSDARVFINNGTADAFKALVVRGASAQQTSLQEWQNASGKSLAYVDQNGNFYLGDGSTSSTLQKDLLKIAYSSTDPLGKFYVDSSGSTSASGSLQVFGNTVTFGAGSNSDARVFINNGSFDAIKALVVRGASAQQTSLQEWQNASGKSLAYVDQNGNLYLGNGTATSTFSANSIISSAQSGFNLGKFYVDSSGNTSASGTLNLSNATLGVVSSTASNLRLAADGTRQIQFWTNAAQGMYIDSSGNVFASGTLQATGNFTTYGNSTFGDTVADTLTFNGVLGTINISDNVNSTTTLSRNSLALGITASYPGTGVFYVDSSGNVSASGTLKANSINTSNVSSSSTLSANYLGLTDNTSSTILNATSLTLGQTANFPRGVFYVDASAGNNGNVFASGTINVGNGSASLPSLGFVNANGTGFFNDSGNTGIGVSIGGTQRMRIQASTISLPYTVQPYDTNALVLNSNKADGASALSVQIKSGVTLSTAGAKILAIYNNASERAFFDKDGDFAAGVQTSYNQGTFFVDGNTGNVSASGSLYIFGNVTSTGILYASNGLISSASSTFSNDLYIANNLDIGAEGSGVSQLYLKASSTTALPLLIQGNSGGSGTYSYLTQWKDSSGNMSAFIASSTQSITFPNDSTISLFEMPYFAIGSSAPGGKSGYLDIDGEGAIFMRDTTGLITRSLSSAGLMIGNGSSATTTLNTTGLNLTNGTNATDLTPTSLTISDNNLSDVSILNVNSLTLNSGGTSSTIIDATTADALMLGYGTNYDKGIFYVDSNGNVAASGTLKLNGQTYTFPSSQSASTYLQTNGSGALTWAAAGGTNDWGAFSTNFGVSTLNTSSTYPVWIKGGLYASSSLYVSGALSTTGTLNVGVDTVPTGSVAAPVHKASITTGLNGPYYSGALFVQGKYAYVTSYTGGTLKVFDISVPGTPVAKGAATGITNASSVYVAGNYAYVTAQGLNQLNIYDVSDPNSLVLKGSIATGGSVKLTTPINVFVSGNYAYVVSAGSDALEIVDISNPANPTHKGSLVTGAGGSLFEDPTSVYVSGKYAYITAINVSSQSLEIVDVSNPASPVHAGVLQNGTGGALLDVPRSVFVSGNFAYVASEDSNALEIIDITNPASPTHKGSLADSGSATVSPFLRQPYDVFVSGNYAYVASSDWNNETISAIEIVDISNPAAPVHKGALLDNVGGALLDGVVSVFVQGNYVYAAAYTDSALEIVDVSGANISNAKIGALDVDTLRIGNYAQFDQNLIIGAGLNVGGNTLLSGDVSIGGGRPTSTAAGGGGLTITTNQATTTFTSYVTGGSAGSAGFVFNATSTSAGQGSMVSTTAGTSLDRVLLAVQNAGTNKFLISGGGNVYATAGFNANSTEYGIGDVAEYVNLAFGEIVEAGDVVVVDENDANKYRKSNSAYAMNVAGVISDTGAFVIGASGEGRAPLALAGLVKVKVNNENGLIAKGDLLVTASSTGYAMKYDSNKDDGNKTVAIIGIATEPLAGNSGVITALLRTGWMNNRNQTLASLQQNVQELAAAQGINLNNNQENLNIQNNNGQLTYNSGNLNLGGYAILNVSRVAAVNNKWTINEQGDFIVRYETTNGQKEMYGLQSPTAEFVFSSSSQLINGEAVITFEQDTREIIDSNSPLKITVTLTSGEAKGIYVSQKDATGFTVKELQGGISNATFDWIVVARRRLTLTTQTDADDADLTQNGGDVSAGQSDSGTDNGNQTPNPGSSVDEANNQTPNSDLSADEVDNQTPVSESTPPVEPIPTPVEPAPTSVVESAPAESPAPSETVSPEPAPTSESAPATEPAPEPAPTPAPEPAPAQ